MEFPKGADMIGPRRDSKKPSEPFLFSSIFHLQNRKEVRICLSVIVKIWNCGKQLGGSF